MTNEFVILGKLVTCPQYNKKLVLSAKYRFSGNPENEKEIQFIRATCPIIENSKLHKDDQCSEYKYLQCFTPRCDLLRDFPSIWSYGQSL